MIQNAPSNEPQTLVDAVRFFADPQHCHDYLMDLKWPGGDLCCIECGSTNVGQIKSRRLFQCREKGCRRQFSLKTNTIFQDSPLGLDKWLVAVWMIANCRNGVSSCEIARTLGIKQQSAWHVLHRVREAMKPRFNRRLQGAVETDETWVGGLVKHMHKDKARSVMARSGYKGKALVQLFLERGGEVRGQVIPKLTKRHVQPGIHENVEAGSKLYTDSGSMYKGLDAHYDREWVNHMFEYARGSVHINSCENFFCLLRRGLKGTYVAVRPDHLEAYVDEQAFRYSWRKESDWTRFDRLMHRVLGERLPYSQLTGGKKR